MLSNSEPGAVVEGWSELAGLNSAGEREITPTVVKASKCRLNAEGNAPPQTAGL